LLRTVAVMVVVAAFVTCGLRPSAQEVVATRAAVGPTLSVGDRAKITFFEMMDVPNAESEQPALRTFYQRMDLTGEYSVEPDGSVSFPRLGRFVVAGRSVPDVQADLATVFERVMGHGCDVNLTIVERQPVYVVGPVKSPGAYKYVPGMIWNVVELGAGSAAT
jgi:protein involved in polysaccharide export with SLBB domain